MNLFETVKTAVNAREAAQLYGVAVNRCGMALCPFHNDHHPSLLVADDHYHCFACGAHGDVIDLAANLFGLSLYDAARKLAADFHLAPDKPPPESICQKLKQKTKAQENVETVRRGSNNVVEFLQSEGYIRFRADYEASSKSIYEAYKVWCEDNVRKPLSANRLSSELTQNAAVYNVEPTNNIYSGGRRVRGFVGIEVVARPFG